MTELLKSNSGQFPAFLCLRAVGSSAGQPQGRVAAGARVPAALVAAACGPGRSGLQRYRQGGPACLTSARTMAQRPGRTGGPGRAGFELTGILRSIKSSPQEHTNIKQ